MASTVSPTLLRTTFHNTNLLRATKPSPSHSRVSASATAPGGRRKLILTLTAATVAGVAVGEQSSRAAEIGLFGIRKGLKKAEEVAEEIVKEGFEAADKGIVTAEKAVLAAEKEVLAAEEGVEAAEKGLVTAVSSGGLAQAAAVVAAELVGILVATTIVNGILGPEAQKSSS